MYKLETKINVDSDDFKKSKHSYLTLLDDYKKILKDVSNGGSESAIKKHKERGKLLARERIDLLVDRNTPFIELSPLASYNLYDNQFPSAGIVTGIGVIHGRECIIIANDATVKGGTYIKESIKKHVRAQEIAMENNLPCVYMVDSGGVFLPEQANVFPDKYDFGRFFFNQARLSSMGIPQISIVMGSCTAGGAYVPAMSDETIIVKNQGTIFIGGPPLVKAATGEEVTAEDLGGAFVHTSISGVADHLADNDIDAIRICRNIFELIPQNEAQTYGLTAIDEPLYPPKELYGLAPVDFKKPVEILEIIARITDGSKFEQFKQNYGTGIRFTQCAHFRQW